MTSDPQKSESQIHSTGDGRPDLVDPLRRRPSRSLWSRLKSLPETVHSLRLFFRPGRSDREHLFITGLSRSGTSLLATRVAAHPRVRTVNGETFFFLKRDFSRVDVSKVDVSDYDRMFRESRTQAQLFDRIADAALASDPEADIFLEKTPDHAFALERLLKIYPKARFVFMIRDPRDAYVSWQKHPNLRDSRPDGFAQYWLRCIAAYDAVKASPRIMPLRYEDLCETPEMSLSRVYDFFGLDTAQIRNSAQEDAGEDWFYLTTGGHDRITRPIASDTVATWKEKLPEEAAQTIGQIAGDVMKIWGYDPSA